MLDFSFTLLFCFIFGYVFGSIPFGYIIGKLKGVDIRTIGSCNIGATNVTRNFGKKWGVPCFFLDAAKGAIPVACVSTLTLHPSCVWMLPYMMPITIIGVVAGHMFPIWLNFKGGKGVSTIIGAIFVLSPLPVLIGLIAWLITFTISRYVSLASIVFAVVMPLMQNILPIFLKTQLPWWCSINPSWQTSLLLTLLCVLMVMKHRSNIKRLVNHQEHRFGNSKGSIES